MYLCFRCPRSGRVVVHDAVRKSRCGQAELRGPRLGTQPVFTTNSQLRRRRNLGCHQTDLFSNDSGFFCGSPQLFFAAKFFRRFFFERPVLSKYLFFHMLFEKPTLYVGTTMPQQKNLTIYIIIWIKEVLMEIQNDRNPGQKNRNSYFLSGFYKSHCML